MRCPFLALALVAAALPALSAEDQTRGPKAMAGRLVGDPADQKLPCCEVNMNSSATATFKRLAAGAYEVEVQGRFLCPYIATFSLDLSVTRAGAALYQRGHLPNSLPADQRPHSIIVPCVMTAPGTLTVKAGLAAKLSLDQRKAFERLQLRKIKRPGLENPDGLTDEDVEELGDLDDIYGPPSGQPAFLLHKVILRPQSSVFVARIRPRKIHYYPDEEVVADIMIGNGSKRPQSVRLTADVLTGLDTVRTVRQETVTIRGGKTVTRELRFRPDTTYGHELRIRLAAADKPDAILHENSEYFGVSESVFEISLGSFAGFINRPLYSVRAELSLSPKALEARARANALAVRAAYANQLEVFSWAPDDFFNLSPEEPGWWSGTMGYPVSRRSLIAHIKALQVEGIKVLSYAQPYAVGTETVRELRRQPEFFAYEGNGAPAVGYDYDTLKAKSRLGPFGKRTVEVGGRLNFVNLATVDRGVDAVIAAHKMFGFDGVRYDNRYYRAFNVLTSAGKWTGAKNLDELSARNVRRQKDRFRKEIGPRFLVSHNNGYRFRQQGNILGWDETVKGGLMCMDEESQAASRGHWPWKDYFGLASRARRRCTELGGYYQYFPPGRGTTAPIDMVYYPITCAATGSHPTGEVESSPAGAYGRFFTRYSAFIFARDLKPVSQPDRLIAPQAPPARLWWQDYAHQRDHGGKRWYCFGLVAPPLEERVNSDLEGKLPLPLTGLTVRLVAPDWPRKGIRVFCLSAEGSRMAQQLQIRKVAKHRVVVLPPIRHFALLVVETEVKP